MGYNVSITLDPKIDTWEPGKISEELYYSLIDRDPELRLDGKAEAETPSGILGCIDKSIAVWTEHSQNGQNGNYAWLWYAKGRIETKNPDTEFMKKLYMAEELGGFVQGEEGELYDRNGSQILDNDFKVYKSPENHGGSFGKLRPTRCRKMSH